MCEEKEVESASFSKNKSHSCFSFQSIYCNRSAVPALGHMVVLKTTVQTNVKLLMVELF